MATPEEAPQGTPPVQLREQPLTYAPWDFATHPIDTAPEQPQGWGPFSGPWMPVDYRDPSQSIDILWTQGDNSVNRSVSPGYDELSLFDDRSIALVFNSSAGVVLRDAAEDISLARTSTISNVVRSNRGFGRVMSALRGR
jgi:hypothetical protein